MSHRLPQRLFSAVLLTLTGLALTGCWELEKMADVNPDGSARLRVDWQTSPEVLQMEGLGNARRDRIRLTGELPSPTEMR